MSPHHRRRLAGLLLSLVLARQGAAADGGGDVVVADFTRPGHGWRANRSVGEVSQSADGLSLHSTGEDPWVLGPVVDVPVPAGTERLLVELDARAPGDPRCYVAGEGGDFAEADAARLVGDGSGTFRGLLPARGPRMFFRLDPPDGSTVTLLRLRVTPVLPRFTLPPGPAAGPAPAPVAMPPDALGAGQGLVRVLHDPARWNALTVWVGDTRMADGIVGETFWATDGPRAVPVDPNAGSVASRSLADGFEIVATVGEGGDPADAATWTFTRRVEGLGRGVRVVTGVAVDRRRELVHLPWLTLCAGLGTFGTAKSQALLPGVEYLDDEPSSGEKEIRGPAANRRLVDPRDVCFPTMALAAEGRWLALDWDVAGPEASPLFDSPDRLFSSGGHLLGLWSPAAGGPGGVPARLPGALAVQRGVVIEPGVALEATVTLRGGFGGQVSRAVADRLRGGRLPALPDGDLEDACRLLARGWLDTAVRDGGRYRHAVGGQGFAPQPAADAAPCMLWLASRTSDAALAARLRQAAAEASAVLAAAETGGIGHVVRPALPLVVHGDAERADAAIAGAGALARRLAAEITAAEGRPRYVPGATDYAATLGADHVNGHTAIVTERMLDAAVLCGDEATIREALAALDLVTRACPAGQVPRGAQPWEIPLHCPDILAAARLARANVLGHLLDGHPRRLAEARGWAWSGVPFVYLRDPVPGAAVGRYATIGVFGATGWEAPVWIGRPVQWCGLVYAAALRELARIDAPLAGTWNTLAGGITRTGLAMTFPADDPRAGLLPDFWEFAADRGDGPAINPATLQGSLAEAFDALPLVTATRLPGTAGHGGHVVHVAGRVSRVVVSDGGATIDLETWPAGPSLVLVTRVTEPPRTVTWNGVAVAARIVGDGCLAVGVEGRGTLVVEW